MTGRVARTGSLVAILGLGLVTLLHGQIRGRLERPSRGSSARRSSLSFLAGPSSYELGQSGTGFAAAVRIGLPTGSKFVIEPGLGFLRYKPQGESRLNYILPEVSFQFFPSSGPVRPYGGAGLGLAEFASGPSGGRGTVHAVAGMRLTIAGRFGVRGEARYRVYDPLGSAGTMLDVEGGGSVELGRRE